MTKHKKIKTKPLSQKKKTLSLKEYMKQSKQRVEESYTEDGEANDAFEENIKETEKDGA